MHHSLKGQNGVDCSSRLQSPELRVCGLLLLVVRAPSLLYSSSKTPVHVEPALLLEETSAETTHSSSSTDPTESQLRSPSTAREEMTETSPEFPDVSGCLSSSYSEVGPGTHEDMFSAFLYWRTPLPDISKDVEVLLSEAGPQEESTGGPEGACDSCVARSELQRVLQSLQGHLLHDPDIQGEGRVSVLCTAQACFVACRTVC